MTNRRQQFIWISIILIFFVSSCAKTGSSLTSPNNTGSYVSLMNQAPYSGAADVYFNGTQVTPSGGIGPEQFSSAYGGLKPGTYTVDFKKAGTDSLLYELPAASYDSLAFYTLILYNTAPQSPTVQAVRITDDFSSVTPSNAYCRFFNLSPDMANVTLYMDGTVFEPNRSPADNVSNPGFDVFQPLAAQVYTMQVKNASDSVLATLNSYPLTAGEVYTIFLEGTSKAGVILTVLPFAD